MTKNNLISLLESDFTSWFSCTNTFAIDHFIIFHILRNYNLNRHISCEHHEIRCLPHTEKRWSHWPRWNQNMLVYIGNWTLLEPYVGLIGSKTRRYKETHTHQNGQSHLMKFTRTSTSWKKESRLISCLSVLSIKFHYINITHHRIFLLAWGHHWSVDDLSSHH